MQYNYQSPLPIERIISALSYLTMGAVGFIWLILGAVMKQNLRPFIKYHIYQSIFLSLMFFIVSSLLALVLNILSYIPIIKIAVAALTFLLTTPVFVFSVIEFVLLAFWAYLVITVIQGKYTFVPWVSNIIKDNI